MRKRAYKLGQRAESMRQRREAILSAARALLLEDGFGVLSVDAVAKRADAGRTTVFEHFGSKAGLLQALEDWTSVRAGAERIVGELQVSDPRAALRTALERGCEVWAAEAPMFQRLFLLRALDPDLAQVMDAKDERRRGLCVLLAQRLARERALAPGLRAADAADLIWILTRFETFDALRAAGRSPSEVAALLVRVATGFCPGLG